MLLSSPGLNDSKKSKTELKQLLLMPMNYRNRDGIGNTDLGRSKKEIKFSSAPSSSTLNTQLRRQNLLSSDLSPFSRW
jgi:hypothetical protein